jgi:hypothetical protein
MLLSCSSIYLVAIYLFDFGTQGIALARQVLYYLSHSSSPELLHFIKQQF